MTIPVSIRNLPNYYPETQDVYSVTINREKIKTIVTKDAATVDEWIDKVYSDYKEDLLDRSKENKYYSRGRFIVGLDVEWKPLVSAKSLHTTTTTSPIATLHLCVGRRCLIYQILLRSDGIPESLHRFLEDDNLRFVGVGIERVAVKLGKDFDLNVKNSVDIVDRAADGYGREDLRYAGLIGLARFVLRCREFEKPTDVAVSNWSQKYLSQEQIMSASVDAYAAFKIGERLSYVHTRPHCRSILDACLPF